MGKLNECFGVEFDPIDEEKYSVLFCIESASTSYMIPVDFKGNVLFHQKVEFDLLFSA